MLVFYLFNNDVSSSDYTVSNGRKTWIMNWRGCGRKRGRSWRNLKYYFVIYMEDLRKGLKTQQTQPRLRTKPGTPEYEARVVTRGPQRPIQDSEKTGKEIMYETVRRNKGWHSKNKQKNRKKSISNATPELAVWWPECRCDLTAICITWEKRGNWFQTWTYRLCLQ
jgi:hypothetical protein